MLDGIAALAVRRLRATLLVSVLLLAGFAAASVGTVGLLSDGGFSDPHAESSRAAAQVDAAFGGDPNLVFLVTPAPGTALDAPAVEAAASAVADRLDADPHLRSVYSYWSSGAAALRADDGRSGLVTAHVGGDEVQAAARAGELITDVAALAAAHPAVSVRAGGELAVNHDLNDQIVVDLVVAEAIAVPITLVLLLFAFGSLVAALLPLLVGLLAVLGAFAVLFVVGAVTDVSVYAVNLATGLGLGLAIDYALLIVNRFREELWAGSPPADAIVVTLRTAGRTVMFSAAIVATALLAMLAFPLYFLRSFAYAGVGVVLVAMLASVVTLPAVLVWLGPRVDAGRLRRSRPLRSSSELNQFWHGIATAVTRRPVLAAAPVVLALLVLSVPFAGIRFATPDDRVLPGSAPSRQVGDVLRTQYGGSTDATIDVLVSGPTSETGIRALRAQLARLPGVTAVGPTDAELDAGVPPGVPKPWLRSGVWKLTVSGPADGSSARSQELVAQIRELPLPPGARGMQVGGAPAVLVDAKASIARGLPLAAGWILVSTFVLLFLFSGGLLVPVKALVLNVLSLSAVFGVLVWIFQQGHLAGPLGITPGPIDTAMPVLLFCIAFGLSMDYEVFLLARIKEEYVARGDNTAAVVAGLSRTGRIVSTSAALLAVTFLAFGASETTFLKLFGIGTALAVVLDATVVRGVLVPALMRLAGRANWWAPPPLRRLHARIGLAETGGPPRGSPSRAPGSPPAPSSATARLS